MQRCNCFRCFNKTKQRKDFPVTKTSGNAELENPYEIDTENDIHTYAGVNARVNSMPIGMLSENMKRSLEDGPLTEAEEDASGYLWYTGVGASSSPYANKASGYADGSDPADKDPGDGLVYHTLEPSEETEGQCERSEQMPPGHVALGAGQREVRLTAGAESVETPIYLEFDASMNGDSLKDIPEHVQITANAVGEGSHRRKHVHNVEDRGFEGTDGSPMYGKLDRSLNKSGHHNEAPAYIDEYGKLDRSPDRSGYNHDDHLPLDDYGQLDLSINTSRHNGSEEHVSLEEYGQLNHNTNTSQHFSETHAYLDEYGKLDRSRNKMGHQIQFSDLSPGMQGDEYGYIAPSLDTNGMPDRELYVSGEGEYGLLQVNDLQNSIAPSSGNFNAGFVDDYMPPNSEDVYGSI